MQQLGCESHSVTCVSCYVHVYGNKVIIIIIIIVTDVSSDVPMSLVVPGDWEQVLLLSRNLKCDSVLLDHDKITNEVIVKLSGKSHCCGRNTSNECCNHLL